MPCEISLENAYKGFTEDQDKLVSPEETVQRFRERLAKVDLDILESTERIDSGRIGIPVYFSRCGADARRIIGTRKQMGKGATSQQAEASAVMELAERFSFFSFTQDDENFVVDTRRNLGDAAISYDLVAQSVHDDSSDREDFRHIFDDLPMKWTCGFNMTTGREVLVPFDWFFMINEFNGPSAGNCREEALLQGICEVVERHVSSLISRRPKSIPAVDAEASKDPMVLDMLHKYHANGIRLFLSDFTMEMGIPTIGVLAYDPVTFPGLSEIVWTAGTTTNPDKALSRALTEVAQLAGDFNSGSNYVASGLPKLSRLEEAAFITESQERRRLAELPDISDDNLRVEVERCVNALAERNFETIVIDTMHPLLAIPAFYTIIPGAHFRERAMGTSVGLFSTKMIAESWDPYRAIQKLETIEKTVGDRYYVQFYLGQCLLKVGKHREAVRRLEKSLHLDPAAEDVPSIHSYLGLSYKEQGDYRKALEVLEEGISLDNDRTDLHNLMGFCYFKLGNHEAAIESFHQVLRIDPGSAIDYANIASNYREMGETDKAIAFYQLALNLDPGIDFARESLIRLQAAAKSPGT